MVEYRSYLAGVSISFQLARLRGDENKKSENRSEVENETETDKHRHNDNMG